MQAGETWVTPHCTSRCECQQNGVIQCKSYSCDSNEVCGIKNGKHKCNPTGMRGQVFTWWRRTWVSVLSSMVLPLFSTGKEGTSGSAIDLNIIDHKNTLVLRIESPSTRQRIRIGKWNKNLKIYLHLEIWQCSLTSLNQQTNKAQIRLWILWQLSCFFYFMLIWEQKKTKGKTRQSRSEEIRNRPVREPWCFSSNSFFGYAKLILYYLGKFDCLGESLLPNDCTLQLEE